MTPDQQRAAADDLADNDKPSQRRACSVLGRARSTVRYRRGPRPDLPPLIREIKRVARRHPRSGYRRIHAMLRRRGFSVNLKRVRRLCHELGLKRPVRLRKPRKLGPKPGQSRNSCVAQPSRFRNDASTLSGVDVRRIVARVIGRRGAPTRIRSDNGSEFICEALVNWLPGVGSSPIPVAAGSPWENGYNESFHSRLRDEFLEREEFESVADARARGSWYRREYNTVRPHNSLGYMTPREFSASCDGKEKRKGNASASK
ncbi:MAG TPA: integrase core domain-containing protein [Isosphaeraceae bacterium]|nr:integrase core domain-containing protein [Isosphaeraceae bacterium]